MRAVPIVLGLLLSFSIPSFSQSQWCTNADFSDSSFVNWTGGIGNCCPISMVHFDTIVSGRHTIMTFADSLDPNTCDSLWVVPSGSPFSARLGNSQIGAQAERLSYTYTVTPANALFTFQFAAVMQDPGHSAADQPRFEIRVIDPNGQVVGPLYKQVSVNSPGIDFDFHSCGNVKYNDWKTVGIDVSHMIGQSVTIQFNTGDCELAGHFGYAYISAGCSPLELSSDFCPEMSDTAFIYAPDGFSYSWSTGETTRSIAIANPTNGSSYSCTLTNFFGAVVTLNKTIETPVTPNFGITYTWQSMDVSFTDSSIANNGSISSWHWDFGDGQTSDQQNPTHTYTVPDVYDVTLTVELSNGCPATYHSQVDFLTVDIPEPTITGFEVYPVPSSDEITVSLISSGAIENMSLTVYDVIGNAVLTKRLENLPKKHSFNLSLGDFATGIYTLELKTKDNSVSRKFIKN